MEIGRVEHFADRLLDAIDEKRTPAVVALDPVFARLPSAVREEYADDAEGQGEAELEAIFEYSLTVLQLIAPIIPAVKINSAYFERYFADGVQAYFDLVRDAADFGLIVIGDVKRGDIGHSAEQYALGHLADCAFSDIPVARVPDAITVNGYLGLDGVRPFVETASPAGRGVFVLVRTSNPSAASIQDVATSDGRKVHELVAAEVARWAGDAALVGRRGYSSIGAVVGTRNAADAGKLRTAMPQSILLVPGYGAQGATAADVKAYFKPDRTGAIVVAGRSVIFAHEEARYVDRFPDNWQGCIEQACRDFAQDLRTAVGM